MVGAQPTPAFVENQLALLRTIDTTGAVAEPAGVTDVKLLRVAISAGDNHTGVRIVASSDTTDVFEDSAPTITSNGGGNTAALSIADAAALTTVTATDPDAGQTLTYSISGGADGDKFAINAVTGALSFVTAPNFEAPTDAGGNNIYDVIVQASDGDGGIDTQAIAVSVNDVTGNTTAIEANGSTHLTAVGDHFFLYDGGGSGPSLKYAGADYVAGQFGAWTPIGAEQTATGYEVAWKVTGADAYTVWDTDSSGNHITNIVRCVGNELCVGIVRARFPPRLEQRRADRSTHDGDRGQWIDPTSPRLGIIFSFTTAADQAPR